MLLKILLISLLVAVVVGGKKRFFGLAQGLKKAPASFREGQARAEDPVPFAKEVRGATRDVPRDD